MFLTENEYADWFQCQMKLAKGQIAAKTNGLVTRQTLRDEKWSEFTLRAIVALMQEEGRAREEMVLEESPFSVFYTRWALQLERLVVEGTSGTVIHVEESERPPRSQIEVEEAMSISSILHPRTVEKSRLEFQRLENDRIYREREECGIVEAEEAVDRFELSEVYEVEWPDIWVCERKGRNDVTLLLLWRVVLEECNARLQIEEYEEVFRESLPTLPYHPCYECKGDTSATPIKIQFSSYGESLQRTPTRSKPPATYAHFGHQFSVIPPLREPGEEPVTVSVSPDELQGSSSFVSRDATSSECDSTLGEDDIPEYLLLQLREEVRDAWGSH